MGVVETTHSVCREKWSRLSFIHLVNVLSTYHVPGTVPGAGNITVNKTHVFTDILVQKTENKKSDPQNDFRV